MTSSSDSCKPCWTRSFSLLGPWVFLPIFGSYNCRLRCHILDGKKKTLEIPRLSLHHCRNQLRDRSVRIAAWLRLHLQDRLKGHDLPEVQPASWLGLLLLVWSILCFLVLVLPVDVVMIVIRTKSDFQHVPFNILHRKVAKCLCSRRFCDYALDRRLFPQLFFVEKWWKVFLDSST